MTSRAGNAPHTSIVIGVRTTSRRHADSVVSQRFTTPEPRVGSQIGSGETGTPVHGASIEQS